MQIVGLDIDLSETHSGVCIHFKAQDEQSDAVIIEIKLENVRSGHPILDTSGLQLDHLKDCSD